MNKIIRIFTSKDKEEVKYRSIDKDRVEVTIGDSKVVVITFDSNEMKEIKRISGQESKNVSKKQLIEA